MSIINHHLPKTVVAKVVHEKLAKQKVNESAANGLDTQAISSGTSIQSAQHHSLLTPSDHADSQQRFKWLHNDALVQLGGVSRSAPIDVSPIQFKQQFVELAVSQKEFHQLMQTAYGDGVNAEQVEALRERVLQQDFSWLPEVHYVTSDTLQGADGAYSASSNSIYLNEDSRDTALGYLVYAEEVGHSIDQLLNSNDASGDEGAVFALALMGAPISVNELALLRSENDTGSIDIDGVPVDVEFSKFTKEIGRAGRRIMGWVDKLGVSIQRLVNTMKGLSEDIAQVFNTVFTRPFEVLRELGSGFINAVELAVDGKFGQAFTAVRDTLVNSGKLALSLVPEVLGMVFSAIVVAVDRLRGAITERPLKTDEINYLQKIFGDRVDYSAINIISGGTKDQWGMDAHVVGTEIFLPNTLNDGTPMFADNGELTPGGLALLGHEVAHVWQYHISGTHYIGSSLVAQAYDGDNDTYDWYHDVEAGTAFLDMNPEKQAEIAGLLGQAIHLQVTSGFAPSLTIEALNEVIVDASITITAEQFLIFQNASVVLNPSRLGLSRSGTPRPTIDQPSSILGQTGKYANIMP